MININKIYNIIIFIFLFIIVSRGLFELIINKKIAFLVQVLAIILFLLFMYINKKIKVHKFYFYINSFYLSLFIIIMLLSAFYTYTFNIRGAPFFYTMIVLFLLITYLLISALCFKNFNNINLDNIVIFLILILICVAIYEQYYGFHMPGAANYFPWVRPASLTGSKQHYSIILSILTLIIFQYWIILKKSKYLLISIIGSLGVIFSLTRSGAFIIMLTIGIYILLKMLYDGINPYKTLLVILFIFIISYIFYAYKDDIIFIERILSSFNTNSPGNSDRVKSWLLAITIIGNSNLLIGEWTGIVTNATRTITGEYSFVVESGPLQMILNFGFIGFILFYIILFTSYVRIKFLFFKSILIACLLSTAVYQSIETIPFMVLIAMLPIFSQHLQYLVKYKGYKFEKQHYIHKHQFLP
ncbi:hypothetical protein [Hydrogenimonas sp. SS33]|uniref:hypothetical protein n=1 Tax=Hydrogenimonas leucolamina TaxID=2954236 RepID=UPI00336BD99F